MDNIPPQYWWLSCALGILVPAGSFVGAWLLNKFWPAFVANRKTEREYREKQDNVALEIAKETIDWSRQELTGQQEEYKKLREAIEESNKVEERRAALLTLQNKILNEIRFSMQEQQTSIIMLIDLLKDWLKNDKN